MFSNKTPTVKTGLDEVIDSVQEKLKNESPDTDKFAKLTDQLDKLYKMRSYETDRSVKLDTLLPVFGNLAGILAILNFERMGVVTSKALSFVVKSKV